MRVTDSVLGESFGLVRHKTYVCTGVGISPSRML